jgi:hypothetical protein
LPVHRGLLPNVVVAVEETDEWGIFSLIEDLPLVQDERWNLYWRGLQWMLYHKTYRPEGFDEIMLEQVRVAARLWYSRRNDV